MNRRNPIVFLAAAVAIVLAWLWSGDSELPPEHLRATHPPAKAAAGPGGGSAMPGVALLKAYAAPESDAPADLRLMHRALENFSLLVKGDDPLPLGSNDEIAAALRGKNKARLVFLPEDHPAFDAQGRLVDRWGTALFFHANSRDRVDIRSAGPDREMWTADDVHQRKDGTTFTGADLPPATGPAGGR